MNRLRTLKDLKAGRIDLATAAEMIGLTERDLKFRITRYGPRLPSVLAALDKIEKDQITRPEAGEMLGISLRQVNQMMTMWGVRRPIREYIVNRTASKVKWEVRKKFAIDYVADECTIEDAAEAASVSARQMRRWVADLLYKHYEMPFKDLKLLSRARRQRLADEIETAEGLESAKRDVAKAIAEGDKTVKEVALERVLAKRSNKGRHVQK